MIHQIVDSIQKWKPKKNEKNEKEILFTHWWAYLCTNRQTKQFLYNATTTNSGIQANNVNPITCAAHLASSKKCLPSNTSFIFMFGAFLLFIVLSFPSRIWILNVFFPFSTKKILNIPSLNNVTLKYRN